MLGQRSTAELKKNEEEYKKKYELCSKEAYEYIRSYKPQKNAVSENTKNIKGYIYYINFTGVQSFIEYFSNLKDISTASFMVDFIVSTLPFVHFDNLLSHKTRLPLEALLVVSGGHSILIGRSDVKPEDFINEIENDQLLKGLDIELSIAYRPFFINDDLVSYDVVTDLIRESQFNNLNFKGTKVLSLGLHRNCDNCKERPAVEKIGEEYLCSRCKIIRDYSNKRGFSARVMPKYYINGKEVEIGYNEIDPMVFISGGRSNDDSRYTSIIKFDANDASKYFANTLTWSEYVDKSFYTDYWIKKSLRDTVNAYYNKNPEMIKRLIAGIQFLGGDEGLLISPSLISINFMIDMINEVNNKTGVNFKVGIATVKPDHPIQFAIFTAEKIMDKAKIKEGKGDNSIGIIFSPSFISPSVVESFQKAGDFTILTFQNTFSQIEEILNDVSIDVSKEDDDNLKDYVRELEDIVEFHYRHKNINETLIYLIRERIRYRKYSQLIDLILKSYDSKNKKINLLDTYFILKNIQSGFSKVSKT